MEKVSILIYEGTCRECGEYYDCHLIIENGQPFRYEDGECPDSRSGKKLLSKKEASDLLQGVKKSNSQKIGRLQRDNNSIDKIFREILL